jgi:hypothetical protein
LLYKYHVNDCHIIEIHNKGNKNYKHMKSKIKVLLFSILLIIVYGCKEQRHQITNASYTIDPGSVEPEDTIRLSTFFKKVNTVILEDNEYAIIGQISAIQIFEDYIFVLDQQSAKKLFIFDKMGKYIRQIGSLGQGPGEYLGINDFYVDAKNKEIYLLDEYGRKIHKYNFETGKHIKSTRLLDGYSYSMIAQSGDNFFVSIVPFSNEKSDSLLMKIDFETGQYEKYLSADKYNAGWDGLQFTEYNFFVSKDGILKYVEIYMNTVFAIDNGRIFPYLTVNHKDWVRKGDLLSHEEYIRQLLFSFGELGKKGRAFYIHNYFEWQDNIFFQYKYAYPGSPHSVLYNKKTKELHQYDYLKNDMLLKNTAGARFIYVNAKAAYECFASEYLPVYYGAKDNLISNLDLSPDLDKREELLKLPEERFIIFEYEFK